jgi:hypothetical protein
MTTEHNKSVVRRVYEEIWTKGTFDLIPELFHADCVNEDPVSPGRCLKGREQLQGLIGMYRATFEPIKMEVTHQWADGDTVITRWKGSGIHSQPVFGIPATKKAGGPEGITISTFRDGKILHDYIVWDAFGLFNLLRS